MSNFSRRHSSTSSQSQSDDSARASSMQFGSNQERVSFLDSMKPEELLSEALNWGGLLLTKSDELDNNALDNIVPGTDLSGALSVASAVMTGVNSYEDSPNQTIGGRALDALLDVSGSLMVGANPVVGAVDTLLPKTMKISELYDGTSSAVSSIAEGLLTEDSTGMEGFMDKAKNGDYSIVMEEAVKAGEFWANQLQ